jgi:hypothetical protein
VLKPAHDHKPAALGPVRASNSSPQVADVLDPHFDPIKVGGLEHDDLADAMLLDVSGDERLVPVGGKDDLSLGTLEHHPVLILAACS